MKQPKALVLFSGGLDSRLVIKILQEQNIELEAVFIKLPFGEGCCNNTACIFNYSQVQGIKLHIIDATKEPLFSEYLEMIKKPKHGYGVSLNPCKDCKVFILKKAKELGEKINADFLATGEVLAQRPNSQYKSHLMLIERKADLVGKILRPLSAKLLPETIAEKNHLVEREKLLSIQGRQRKKQLELAKKYKIKYPAPAGGCLLCEKEYCRKLKDILATDGLKYEDILLLGVGRHFRSKETNNKIIIGKNENENKELELINQNIKYNILVPKKVPGPTVIFKDEKDKELAEELLNAYSSKDKSLVKKFQVMRI
ncbi:tRNA-specific 2-thiouridylase MnmA [uncultured archaeon]|nr:tRNA-specific 2-thiouridylase MnmA [uncultured archaeon]